MLLSPSLRDRVGHYHDYADRVLKAAAGLGYRAHVAASRAHTGELTVTPVFRRTCSEAEQGGARRIFGPDRYQQTLGRLLRRPAAGHVPTSASTPGPDAPTPTPGGRGLLRGLFQAWRYKADRWADVLAAREFAADLQALYDTIGVRLDDLALLADAGVTEVRGLAHFLRYRPALQGRWAVMLRRDVTDGAHSRWTAADWAGALGDLAQAGRGRARLYADTEGLARRYAVLSGLPVGQLPIPVVPCPRLPPAPVFQAVYLGDARDEKGFPVLAQAVLDLEAERRASAVAFTLQSHFNSSPGDPATVRAHAALRDAGPGVRLIDTVLDTETYGALLGGADVVLTPYDPVAYRARSSGVMSEALATGAPVLVTAGSWMAGQVQPAEQAHLAGLRDRLTPLPVEAGVVMLSGLELSERVLVELATPHASEGIEAHLTFKGAGAPRAARVVREAQASPLLLLLHTHPGETSLAASPDATAGIARAWRVPVGIPASAVGVIVDHGAQGVREGVAEVMGFREHYRATAAASPWAQTHSGQALVERLAADLKT